MILRFAIFGQRAFRQSGDFLSDDMAVQIQRFDIDAEVCQRGDGEVVPDLSLLLAINSYYEGSSRIYWQIANDVIAACGQ